MQIASDLMIAEHHDGLPHFRSAGPEFIEAGVLGNDLSGAGGRMFEAHQSPSLVGGGVDSHLRGVGDEIQSLEINGGEIAKPGSGIH